MDKQKLVYAHQSLLLVNDDAVVFVELVCLVVSVKIVWVDGIFLDTVRVDGVFMDTVLVDGVFFGTFPFEYVLTVGLCRGMCESFFSWCCAVVVYVILFLLMAE